MQITVADILDDCLDLLDNGASLEECLAQYPDQADELRMLLTAVTHVQRVGFPELSEAGYAAANAKARQALIERARPARRWGWFGARQLTPLAVRFAAFFILLAIFIGGATVDASQRSVPGDALYSLKRGVEHVQLQMTAGDAALARLHLELAGRRADELQQLLKNERPLDPQLFVALEENYDAALQAFGRLNPDEVALYRSELATLARQSAAQLRAAQALIDSPQQLEQLRRAIEKGATFANRIDPPAVPPDALAATATIIALAPPTPTPRATFAPTAVDETSTSTIVVIASPTAVPIAQAPQPDATDIPTYAVPTEPPIQPNATVVVAPPTQALPINPPPPTPQVEAPIAPTNTPAPVAPTNTPRPAAPPPPAPTNTPRPAAPPPPAPTNTPRPVAPAPPPPPAPTNAPPPTKIMVSPTPPPTATPLPTSTPFVPTATPLPTNTPFVPTATLLPTSTPTSASIPAGDLKVRYMIGDGSATNNLMNPRLVVANAGIDIPLSELTIRYWYTRDDPQPQTFTCDYARVDCANVTGQYVQLDQPRNGADGYVEIRFSAGAGTVTTGADSGEIHFRMTNAIQSNYDETNDHSYSSGTTSFKDWSNVTLYRNGTLIWGKEPE